MMREEEQDRTLEPDTGMPADQRLLHEIAGYLNELANQNVEIIAELAAIRRNQ